MKTKKTAKRARKPIHRKTKKSGQMLPAVSGTWPVDVTLGVGDWPDVPVETRAGICGLPPVPKSEENRANGGPRSNGTAPDEPVRL